ncbi:MAG: hypothetical protein Q9195_005668 [Heterodermia aff. obscurata]
MEAPEPVKPLKAAPAQVISLSPADQIMTSDYVCFLMLFPLPVGSDYREVYSKLATGLSLTLSEIPLIGGYIAPVEGSDGSKVQINVDDGYGVDLIYRDLTSPDSHANFKYSYEELKRDHFPCSAFDPMAFMPLQLFMPKPEPAVMAAQLNFINGGLIMSICINHKASDGMALAAIIRAWAKHTKVADTATDDSLSAAVENITPRSMDRSPMCNGLAGGHVEDFPEYKVADDKGATNPAQADVAAETAAAAAAAASASPSNSPPGPLKLTIVHFPAERLAHLKQAASPPNPSDGWISTNDAICALLWRNISRVRTGLARQNGSPLPPQSPLNFTLAVEARRRLDPPLSKEYLGSAGFYCPVSSDLDTVASPSTPLPTIAKLIREAVGRFDSTRIRGVIGLIESMPKASDLQIRVYEDVMRGLVSTSWVDMGLYDIEWGPSLGKTESVRVPNVTLPGGAPICGIFPRRPDGGVEVMILVEEEAIQALKEDEEFTTFAEWRGT